MKRCDAYCGVACVDGSCPIASRLDYFERGYDTINSCDECHYYKGCEDCCFEGDIEYCPNIKEATNGNN